MTDLTLTIADNRPLAVGPATPDGEPMTPVVLIAEELAPAAIDVLAYDFDVRHVDGTDRAALLAALADADALIVRSATRVDAEVIGAGHRLKVVARAGVGPGQRRRPGRHRPRRHGGQRADQQHRLGRRAGDRAAARGGPAHRQRQRRAQDRAQWKRSAYTGVEVQGKTVGVVGLGRIGVLFAQRMAAFGTRLIAYDPYVQPARAAQLGVRLVGLDELLRESDFISVHLPRTPETFGLIGEKELGMVKPGVRIVNAARGGLIDEQALADALREGRVAGAGSTSSSPSRPPSRRCSSSTTWWSPRTWAPPPSRRRTRPAWRWPAASSWRCRASSSPTR